MSAPRPRRQRKADRILHGDRPAEEIQIDYALGPLDHDAEAMDRKWGIDRLPELVSPETAAKYGSVMAALNQAIRDGDLETVIKKANTARRGLIAMDAEATEAGHAPADPQVIEYDLDGWRIGIMPDGRNWKTEAAARPDLTLFTMREAAVALSMCRDAVGMLDAVKTKFPGAEVQAIRERPAPKFEEAKEIPF